MSKDIVIKENISGSDVIQQIIKKHNIDERLYYVYSFKVKEGNWNTAAKKREQSLTWTREEDPDGNPIQIMEGFSKHFPEFMVADNKINSIEIVFKRKPIESDILESFKELIVDLPSLPLPTLIHNKITGNGVAAELTTFDAHLGKLAWLQEKGYRNYDLKISAEDFTYVSDRNLDLITPHKPEKLFYIIGQDLYHIDNMSSHTTKGEHTLDVDGRITKIHNKAFTISRDNIYKASLIAPVEVVWIPGNHDFLASFMLVFALKEHFRNHKRITFDIGENPRKARLWGNLMNLLNNSQNCGVNLSSENGITVTNTKNKMLK